MPPPARRRDGLAEIYCCEPQFAHHNESGRPCYGAGPHSPAEAVRSRARGSRHRRSGGPVEGTGAALGPAQYLRAFE